MTDEALLDQMLTEAGVPSGDDRAQIRRHAGERVFPLSFQQELLWLFDRTTPGLHVYNIMRTVRLRGPFDARAFELSLDAVVARHEILRTTYLPVDGVPRQLVNPPQHVPIAWHVVPSRAAVEPSAEARRMLNDLVRRPFDLTRDLQLRASVLQLGEDDHVVLLESHHIATDEWSRNILFDEIAQLYDGYRKGGAPPELRPPAIQYGDFAAWQRERMAGSRLDTALAYWRAGLADIPAALELPTDSPHPAVPGYDGDIRRIEIDEVVFAQLQRIGNERRATPFMTLLAALALLLGRYAQSEDVVIGTPIAGRDREELDGLPGYFVNLFPLRVCFHDAPSFEALLDRVRETVLGAYDHLEVPYERLMELAPPTSSGRSPLVQVTFALVDAEPKTLELAQTTVVPFDFSCPVTKFDLEIFVRQHAGRLFVEAQYRTELFNADTIDRMLANFRTLLGSIARNPAASVRELPMRADSESALVESYNSTAEPHQPQTLDRLIAAQVARHPEAIALEWTGGDGARASLSYRELEERAASLAARLRTLGVGPSAGVAVCMPRSPELVVGMLGVLKAGGYYVPLESTYPPERLRNVFRDADVRIVLTVASLEPSLRPLVAVTTTILALDDESTGGPATAVAVSDREARDAIPEDTAYVIYTSGSTGKPKGVVVAHSAVSNYLSWMQRAYAPKIGEGVLQRAPASFDASVWEFFLPLVSGARLVLAPTSDGNDPLALLAAIERHDVRLAQFVPSQLQMILDAAPTEAPRALGRLRRLFLGGERLPPELLDRFFATCREVPVTNLYGPTEATVYATHWDVSAITRQPGAVVPLGRPIDNVNIYIRDSHFRTVPLGVAGELCIGGAGLADGYLHDAKLTSERFVRDDESGQILYRTGDLARLRADGTLEYLGRFDTQVKLRGFRVELGEIEAELSAQREVESAVVLVRTIGLDQHVIAHCIPSAAAGDLGTLASTLRARLRTTLPSYMIPAAFDWVDAWPLNANGKLDRSVLAERDSPPRSELEPFIAPRTPLEERVVRIWTEVLRCDRIGVRDNFFDLGGHSILAMRIVSRIEEALGARLPLAALFDRPTVAEMALLIVQSGSATAAAPALRRVPRTVVKL
jgi:amino acid adenylation domain-containing protein